MAYIEGGKMVTSGIDRSQLKERFKNRSFTMTEFLEYVLWTRDMKMVDPHWIPITENCNLCTEDFSHVLHVEEPQESKSLFRHLNVDVEAVPQKHVSLRGTQDRSDRHYFNNVPRIVMMRIFDMYKNDFKMLGYNQSDFNANYSGNFP